MTYKKTILLLIYPMKFTIYRNRPLVFEVICWACINANEAAYWAAFEDSS